MQFWTTYLTGIGVPVHVPTKSQHGARPSFLCSRTLTQVPGIMLPYCATVPGTVPGTVDCMYGSTVVCEAKNTGKRSRRKISTGNKSCYITAIISLLL